MQGIEDALKVVGDDSMKNLFDFCMMRQELSNPDVDFFEWVEATRTLADVGLAIYGYAVNKERICRE